MNYEICGFTHLGTRYEINQDRILVQDVVLSEGFWTNSTNEVFCFVADGVGGSHSGEVAAEFVLQGIRQKKTHLKSANNEQTVKELEKLNQQLIRHGRENGCFGTGCTLAGLMADKSGNFQTISTGDSEIYAFRNNMMFRINEIQVIDEWEENSPITGYFGGKESMLDLDFSNSLNEILPHDVFVICSDGLLKPLKIREVKKVLQSNELLQKQAEMILEMALQKEADDNISVILVRVVE